MRFSTSLVMGILCSALYACSGDANTSDVAGALSVSASQLKASCDQASTELEQSTRRLDVARKKAERMDESLTGCKEKGIERGMCIFSQMEPDLVNADTVFQNESTKNTEAQKKKATACAAAFNAEQNVSKSNPEKVPSKGCYVFRGSKTVTVDGRQIKLGDDISSVPLYIEEIIWPSLDADSPTVVRIRPKGGANRCKQFLVSFKPSELFYPTSAEESKCDLQCGQESVAISARPAGASAGASGAAVGACFKTLAEGYLFKDQFKSVKLNLVGKSQTYYAHAQAGNMVFVTVKSGSYRDKEGWMDRADFGGSQASKKVACPQ